MGTSRWHGGFGLLAMALLAGQPAAAAPASKVFRDWVAACDNLGGCTAASLPGEMAEVFAYLKLERPAGSTGAAAFSVVVRADKLKQPLSAKLTVDGAPFPAGGGALTASLADVETATVPLPAAQNEALVAAARKATGLKLEIGGRSFTISLAGAVAAMLWIDEQQGRLGTASALIRKGDKPAASVPTAPALPVILAKPTAALPAIDAKVTKPLFAAVRRQLKTAGDDTCEENDGTSPATDKAWPLDGGRKLVGLYCGSGAYNILTGYWLVGTGAASAARPVKFPQQDSHVLINSEYAPTTGQIEFFAKGRGIGDCGTAGNYAWTGSEFVLTALATMETCRGLPPNDWLTLFRSEVKLAK